MRRLSGSRYRRLRIAGYFLLIIGLVHAPLPQADFHVIRHQDAPGQICEHHDHLLRWHSGTTAAVDVAVLHWHWIAPPAALGDSHSTPGPKIHAHTDDWLAPSPDPGPPIVRDNSSRPLDLSACPALMAFDSWLDPQIARDESTSGRFARRFPSATAARSGSLVPWLQRWTC
jgi:hypothetical protein